jgi:hypothetical protein
MRKAFDWKRYRIYILEVEAVPQSCVSQVQIGLSIALYMSSLLLVERFDLRSSNQYILVRVIVSCFRFAKICLCQVNLVKVFLNNHECKISIVVCILYRENFFHQAVAQHRYGDTDSKTLIVAQVS